MDQSLIELLDPELREPMRQMMEVMPPTDFRNIPAARKASKKRMAEMKSMIPDTPGVISEDRMIPGPDGEPDVPIRIYRPEKTQGILPGLLWIHGGGYMFGDIEGDDQSGKRLSLTADCVVIAVDYRLAPENPYPAPLEDCYTALKYMKNHSEELKIDPTHMAIGGASAGGGLAAGLALLVRDRAEINIIYQLLIYPMINDCNIEQASKQVRDALFWTREHNINGWRSYLGCEPAGDNVHYCAAAYRADDLKRLPPAYIAVGDLDLFAEEDVEYARRLIAAGISTELHVYPGGCHAFDGMVPYADVSKRFTADINRALRKVLHP